jgi:hypothetical protein
MARARQKYCAGRERSEIQKQDYLGPGPILRTRKNLPDAKVLGEKRHRYGHVQVTNQMLSTTP